MSELYELVPAIVERQLHIQEKLRCKCGETVITADGPTKVFDKARVGPTFMAQVAVSKCADALPLHRQAKAYRRVGVQVNDSTLGDYFHRTAEITKPISDRLLDVIAEEEIVLADETSHRVQAKGKTRRSWLWSFIAKDEAERRHQCGMAGHDASSRQSRRSMNWALHGQNWPPTLSMSDWHSATL